MQKLGNVLINVMQDLSRISTNGQAYIRVNGNISDSETFETLFQYFSQGTLLEHIDLKVEEMSPRAECVCGYTEEVGNDHDGYIRCPQCGKYADVNDKPYQIEKPNPQKTELRKRRTF